MKNKIIAIKEKLDLPLKQDVLPDGLYHGTWGGYLIIVEYKDKKYEMTTDKGVKGTGIKVVVEINNGIPTFDPFNS